ncbi:MAG: hypothetical protein H7Y31_12030 [Chitinophagaceae bacterium]|nr:hypothetical protein [Chitinophagaceae bacterium]
MRISFIIFSILMLMTSRDHVKGVVAASNYGQSMIDSLQPGQAFAINVKSVGCFHQSQLRLVIERKVQGYYADFKMEGNIEGQKVKRSYKPIQLNHAKLDSIREFERQLKEVSSQTNYCTTVDTYALSFGSVKKIYTTDKCEWPGIGKLTDVLFEQ